MNPEDLSDAEMIKVIEAAQGLKDTAVTMSFDSDGSGLDESQTGIPRSPGYEPEYGQTMKDAPEMPPDPEPVPQAESLAEAISPDSKVSEFDKALEALQQQGQQHDEGTDLDR